MPNKYVVCCYREGNDNKMHALKKIEMISQNSPNLSSKVTSPPNPSPSPPRRCVPSSVHTEIITVTKGAAELAVMPGDGHCLFSALLHQLGKSNPSLPDHMDKVKHLRLKVANYIKIKLQEPDNELWLAQVEDSISAQPNTYHPETPLDVKIITFITNLGTSNEWGGLKTLVAVAEFEKVKIVTYFDNTTAAQHITPQSGDGLYNKTLRIAYRRQNHYDSVIRLIV